MTHGTKKISAATFVYKAVLCFVVALLQDNYFSGFAGILSFLKKLGLYDNPYLESGKLESVVSPSLK